MVVTPIYSQPKKGQIYPKGAESDYELWVMGQSIKVAKASILVMQKCGSGLNRICGHPVAGTRKRAENGSKHSIVTYSC